LLLSRLLVLTPISQIYCLPSPQLASGAVSGAKGRPTAQHAAPASTEAEHLGHANVLVAHLQEGIEAIHLYTGAPPG
jgi:hypothetical protein